MDLVVRIPDECIDPVRDRLPPPEMGTLEAIALDAILAYLMRLDTRPGDGQTSPP